jgi:MSHA biogenesis protein MshK
VCRTLVGLCMLVLVNGVCLADDQVRDPTTPLGHTATAVEEGASPLVLNSVLIGPGRKMAVINGMTVRVGQTLPGFSATKVQRISAQTVVLQQDGKTLVLTLSPSVVKKNSSNQ